MHKVCFVLEQFVNTLNDVPFSEHDMDDTILQAMKYALK